MTDLTSPPSARRFASFLDRECCVWMPSTSVALLSALVTGKGRPKRLLVQENAPAFVSNIGLITGAAPVKVHPSEIDRVIEELLRGEGLKPDQIWGVATHLQGDLSPTDWLSICAASGIPTVELCLGSLFALARWGASPATFTIVDLDAEPAFAGARLSALLTSDRTLAVRVERLCLPGPEARDYVFDAWPRGLAHDEPALLNLVERVTEPGGPRPLVPGDTPALTLPLTRPLAFSGGRAEGPAAAAKAADKLAEDNRWRARFEEAAALHAAALKAAEERASTLQTQIDEQRSLAEEGQLRLLAVEREAAARAQSDSAQLAESRRMLDERQRIIEQWEARFHQAEAESEKDAPILSRAKAEHAAHEESSRALASMRAEKEALARTLQRTERERDLAVADAARQDESVRRIRSELQSRVEQFERAAAASAQQDAQKAAVVAQSLAPLKAQVARLEAEKAAQAGRLAELERELSEARSDAARRAVEQRALRDEETALARRLEAEIAALGEREAARVREQASSQQEWTQKVAGLKIERNALETRVQDLEKERERAERLEAEAAALKEREALLARESREWVRSRDDLSERIRRLETERDALNAQLKDRDGEHERAERLKADITALKEREASLSRKSDELIHSRDGLLEKISRLEAEAALAEKTFVELRTEKSAAEAALAQARAEVARLEEAQRTAAAEQRTRAERLEAEATALRENEARLSAEWTAARAALSEQIRRLEVGSATAQKALAELLAEKAAAGPALVQAKAQAEAAADRLAEAERGQAEVERGRLAERAEWQRERALLLSEKEDLAGRLAAAKAGQDRVGQSESTQAIVLERGQEEERAWEPARAQMLERIARLEASALEQEKSHQEQTRRLAAEAEQALASLGAENEARSLKLAEVEKEVAARAGREDRLKDEWEATRTELAERMARLEEEASSAEQARADLEAQKTEGDHALDLIRAESEDLARKLAAMERAHATALSEAASREESLRQALDAEKQRVEQLHKEAASKSETQEEAGSESAVRAEWSERVRRAEEAAAAAADAHADLQAQKAEMERSIESLQAEREALLARLSEAEKERDQARADLASPGRTGSAGVEPSDPLAEQLLGEAARTEEPKTRENWRAERLEMVARIARLEAAGVIADKARAELMNRKRDSDRALAEAQAERVALLKKLATAERERDEAQAVVTRPGTEPGPTPAAELRAAARPAQPAPPAVAAMSSENPGPSGSHTGGLSALVNLWNTAVIRRPSSAKESAGKVPDPVFDASALEIEAISSESSTTSGSEPEGEGAGSSPPAPAREPARPPAPVVAAPMESAPRNSGGLSALVNLWTTAKTMRPFRRKETVEIPPPAPAGSLLGAEVPPKGSEPASRPAPAPPSEAALPIPRPPQVSRPRQGTPPRRPDPKPAPVPDDTEKLGGWLRGLANRMRGGKS